MFQVFAILAFVLGTLNCQSLRVASYIEGKASKSRFFLPRKFLSVKSSASFSEGVFLFVATQKVSKFHALSVYCRKNLSKNYHDVTFYSWAHVELCHCVEQKAVCVKFRAHILYNYRYLNLSVLRPISVRISPYMNKCDSLLSKRLFKKAIMITIIWTIVFFLVFFFFLFFFYSDEFNWNQSSMTVGYF